MSGRIRPIQKAKRILRREVAFLLSVLSEDEKRKQSLAIYERVFGLPEFQKAKRFSTYISTVLDCDTEPIIRYAIKQNKTCFVPRYRFRKKLMEMVMFNNDDDLEAIKSRKCRNIHNIRHSDIRAEALSTGGLDLMIVSGLAYTKHGKRLGRGGGYYDTYLKRLVTGKHLLPTTMALAFREQMFPYLPTHLHDVNIDIIVTPDDVFRAKRHSSSSE